MVIVGYHRTYWIEAIEYEPCEHIHVTQKQDVEVRKNTQDEIISFSSTTKLLNGILKFGLKLIILIHSWNVKEEM